MRTQFLYIVEAQNGLVKIGISEKPEARADLIRAHSPVLVRLVAKWAGSARDELELHSAFASFRSHNEWFRHDGPLEIFVRAMFGSGMESVPHWSELTFSNAGQRRIEGARKQSEIMRRIWAIPGYRDSRKAWRHRLRASKSHPEGR